jgi:hypothetical protein
MTSNANPGECKNNDKSLKWFTNKDQFITGSSNHLRDASFKASYERIPVNRISFIDVTTVITQSHLGICLYFSTKLIQQAALENPEILFAKNILVADISRLGTHFFNTVV